MTKTSNKIVALLSDGRELIYFDDENSSLSAARKTDTREKSERPEVAEMRLDSLTGDWISVASARQTRAFLPPAHLCPLCPSSEDNASEIPDNFDIAVFENKSPSFGPATAAIDNEKYGDVSGNPLGTTLDSIGRCEVVVFSSEHEGSLANMPLERIRNLIEVWADRTEALQSIPGIRQVFPFENRGEAIGVTLHHPHGQIYGYPFVTPRTKKLLAAIEEFGSDLFEKTLQFERASERVLIEGDHFTAYVPFAARWPLEIHLLPHRHVQHFGQLTGDERSELAVIYKKLLGALDNIYDTPTPYISAWHQAPVVSGGENVRLQLQITSPRRGADKLKYLAGSESAMGAFIADISPEAAAEMIRRAI
jgi:UDPglucose--hexose-1-phosphate uridylyltransferase